MNSTTDMFSVDPTLFTQFDDPYLQKLLSLDPSQPFPGLHNTTGLSPPESSSDSASPESSNETTGVPTTTAMAVPVNVASGDKRKTAPTKPAGALKDRRSSSDNAEDSLHTHPDDDDDDDGKGGKGGKTSERRRAQNRAAQRAFRERKEKHLKELEDRVFSLEQQSTEQSTENEALKQLLERLQSENERLKVFETAFSFSYAKDVSNSSAMPTSTQFKPPTPPTAQDEVEDLSAFSAPSSFSNNPSRNSSSTFAAAPTTSAPSPFGGASLFSPINGGHASGASSFTSSPQNTNVLDDSLFFNALSGHSPASTTGSVSSSSLPKATTPPSTADLFSAYRDPNFGAPTLNSLNDFDSLFGNPSLGGFGSPDDVLNQFIANSPSPPIAGTTSSAPSFSSAAAPSASPAGQSAPAVGTSQSASPASATGASPCAYGTENKYEFDLDGLCSEMAQKAVCREKGRQALQAAMDEDAETVSKLFGGQL